MMAVADVVAPDHPAFAGHFPGDPVVPGVLLLSRVLAVATRAFGAAVARVPAVKFVTRLGPGERFDIELADPASRQVKFRVLCGTRLVAQGVLELEAR